MRHDANIRFWWPVFMVLLVVVGFGFGPGCDGGLNEKTNTGSTVSVDSLRDDPFVDDVERRTFAWFWELTDSTSGLTPDREPSHTFASIAAVGFGLTAYGIGAERGYVTRAEAARRTLNTLRYFWELPQGPEPTGSAGYRGFYYHFLDFEHGLRFRTTQLSTIDTALLMAGVLFSGSYFGGADPQETAIRAYSDSLYRRVDWQWFAQDEASRIVMAWRPEQGFGPHAYRGYNEAMILYLLAMGSPTHPVSPDVWSGYTSSYNWAEFYGREYLQFGPHFGHQYSHVWIDFRGIRDSYMAEKGIDYFENSRRATMAQREYARQNPGGYKGYSETVWGLTASDGPARIDQLAGTDTLRFFRYTARGVSADRVTDDGTIAPTAAGASMPFAPQESVAALKEIRNQYGDLVYNRFGFVDAFNPTFTFDDIGNEFGTTDPVLGWFDSDQLGIDQGPIIAMIENYRSGLVWEVMKRNEHVIRGLCLAGFEGGWIDAHC